MAQFLPYERVHHYSGRAMTAPARASNFEIDEDDDKENSSVYAGEDTNAGMFGKSRRSSQPKNATLCYVMDGGGLTLRGDTTSNMGKFRLKEHERINSENMRTHDRLTKPDGPCRSYIPKTRKSKKPTGIVSQNGETRRRKERERLAAENRKLTKALNGIYRGKARLEKHGVKKKDCRKIWSNRTSIYDVENMRKNGIIKAKTGVPKTAALVACGGCGLKTFYGADGLTVHKGNHGNMDAGHTVYYCNDVCAAVDWEINRENINVQHKGFRPLRKANYWVQSRAASKARAMLRRAVKGGELPDLDRIMHEIRVQRSVGAAQSAAIAKKLPGNEEEDRQAGMSGTDKAKRHIIRGAAHLVDFDSYPEPDVWFGKEPPKGSTREQIAREKRERYNADVKEVERIVREGNMMGKGMGEWQWRAAGWVSVFGRQPLNCVVCSKARSLPFSSYIHLPSNFFPPPNTQWTRMQGQKLSRRRYPTRRSGKGEAKSPSRQIRTQVLPSRTPRKCTSHRRLFKGKGMQRQKGTRRRPPRLPTGEGRPRSSRRQGQSTKPTTKLKKRGRASSTSGGSTTSQSPRGGSSS